MSKFASGERCLVCEKRVYVTEKITADGKPFHKTCFRCTHCAKVPRRRRPSSHRLASLSRCYSHTAPLPFIHRVKHYYLLLDRWIGGLSL